MKLTYRGVSYQLSHEVVAPTSKDETRQFLGQTYSANPPETTKVYSGWLQFHGLSYAC